MPHPSISLSLVWFGFVGLLVWFVLVWLSWTCAEGAGEMKKAAVGKHGCRVLCILLPAAPAALYFLHFLAFSPWRRPLLHGPPRPLLRSAQGGVRKASNTQYSKLAIGMVCYWHGFFVTGNCQHANSTIPTFNIAKKNSNPLTGCGIGCQVWCGG
eukprot:gene11410-biopygen16866